MVFVTRALVVCLICAPLALGPAAPMPRGAHIRQTTRAHVTNTKCNTFTPKIKGIQRVTYLTLPWFEGNIFDVTLVRGQYRGRPRLTKALLRTLYL